MLHPRPMLLLLLRGAEILDSEFEREWKANGGETYVKSGDRKRQ